MLDVDQLKDLGDVSNSKSQTPCSSCMTDSDNELGPTNDAIIECLTCDLKYCLEHSEVNLNKAEKWIYTLFYQR